MFFKTFSGCLGAVAALLVTFVLFWVVCAGGCAALFHYSSEGVKEAREKAEQNPKEETRAGEEARAKALLEKEAHKVTLEKYRKVETGMTYDQVHKIVGVHGEELSRVELGGVTTVCIAWKNADGSNMLLTFQGGR